MKQKVTKKFVIFVSIVFAILVWIMFSQYYLEHEKRLDIIECTLWGDCVEQRPIKVTQNNVDLEGYHSKCIETETIEHIEKLIPEDLCYDEVCGVRDRCKEFMREHNINTSGEAYYEKHKRNPKLVIPDFCDFNIEEDWDECISQCMNNYYYDEIEEYRWNETICKEEMLVR